VESKSIAKIEF